MKKRLTLLITILTFCLMLVGCSDKKDSFTKVNFGETINTDFCQMSIDKITQANRINPGKTSGLFYSYKADKKNEHYYYLTGTIKNISAKPFSIRSSIKAEICFDDKYKYNTYLLATTKNSDDIDNYYLKPFQEATYYLIDDIPDELLNNYHKVSIKFGFNKDFKVGETIKLKDFEYLYEITAIK